MIFSVLGARPQFIKAAVVSRALARRGLPEVIVHTGQHYDEDLSDRLLKELEIRDVIANLGVILSGVLVLVLSSRLPDLLIGAAISGIVLRGGRRIIREAAEERAKGQDG